METLRLLRKEKGLSMKELGETLGLAESTISQYETGKREPNQATLRALADYFHVTIDYLLTGKTAAETEISFDSFDYALHNESCELSEENKQTLLQMARFMRESQKKDAP